MNPVDNKKKKNKKVNPPFGYFGAKNKIALQLCTHLPPHNCWVEAFCGSAALTLRKSPAPIEIINDIDKEVINFFEQLRNNFNELYSAVELTPYSEHELSNARITAENLSGIERARRFLIQSMMAVNGVFGEEMGGFSYSDSYARNSVEARVNRWNNLPERLAYVVERLKNVRIENKNAIKLIQRFADRPATLIYLDPPYLGDRVNGYNKDANYEEFHFELLELANLADCMLFISGYENELYDSILTKKRGWQRTTINTITRGTKGDNHNRTEVLWTNRHFQKALKTKKLPIKLTEKEIKEGKINPIR